MNIMYFSNSNSVQGGAELNMLRICKHFNYMDNINVFAVLSKKEDIYFRYVDEKINVTAINSIRPSFSGGIKNIIKFIFNFPVTVWKLRRFIKKHKIDIVHANDIIDFPVLIAAKGTKAKVCAHIRFIFSRETLYTKFLKKIYLKYTDKIICVSNAVKEKWFPNEKKAIVVYNGGPEIEKYVRKDSGRNERFTIVSVGKLVNITGHENLIDGIALLPADIKENISVIIVGGSAKGHEEYEEMLYQKVRDNKLDEIISFVGYQKDIPHFLNKAHLFCFMTKWNHSFPTVVLEAEAMELPIIAFSTGGIPEQVVEGENAYLVRDSKELAEKIELFYKNKQLLMEFSLRSREVLLKKFSLEKHFKELNVIYTELENKNG